MEKALYDNYVNILKHELIPALGCTEPIAIAYASAKARQVLGDMPDRIEMNLSGNIIKNVKGVTVPNSGGLKGMEVAAVLGAVGGNADVALEVLESVKPEDIELTKKLVAEGICSCELAEGVANLYVEAKAIKGEHYAKVTIVDHHTNITKIEKDGEIYVIEITGRAGGTCLPEMVGLYYGIDYYEAIARLALDMSPEKMFAGIAPHTANLTRTLISYQKGLVRAIHNENLPSEDIIDLSFNISPGDRVRRYENGRDRLGQVILTGRNLDTCEKRLEDILSKINIEFTE